MPAKAIDRDMTTQRSNFVGRVTAVAIAAAWLAGCSAAQVTEHLPAGYGLPQGTPARPTAQLAYPAVHDMPPARADTLMDEDEKKRLQDELNRTRERQDKLTEADRKPGDGKSPLKRKDKPKAEPKGAAGT